MNETFRANWDRTVRIVSIVSSIALIGGSIVCAVACVNAWQSPVFLKWTLLAGALICVCGLIGAALCAPRSYVLSEKTLVIVRWIGNKTIDLNEIAAVEHLDDRFMKGTWRIFGSGGLFGYFGKFYNRALGRFYMSASRTTNLVLLRTAKGLVVISPDSSDRFVQRFAR